MFSGIINAVGNAIKAPNVLPAIIGGGASLIGGMFTNQAQANQAASAMAFSADQAEKQMEFQERMRETQYQTTVKDLMAAGLNPMLAYSQGGAGTPAGSAAVGQQATLRNPTEGLAASAAQIGNIQADLDLKTANTNESYMRADNISADTKLKLLQAPNVSQTLKNLISEQLLNEARTTATNAEEAVKRNIAQIQRLGDIPEAKSKGKYFTEWPNAYQAKEQSQIAHSATSAAGNIIRGTSNMFRPNTGPSGIPKPARR
jgi:hypothetical protein